MSGRAYSIVRRLLVKFLERLSNERLQELLVTIATRRAKDLSPADGLRFLLSLEAALYPMQGQLAIAYGSGIHTKHRHIHHDFFVSRISEGEKVLDLGCSNGVLDYDIAHRAGAYITGLDLNAANIAVARERYAHSRVEYRVGDARYDLPQGPFDVVILSNLLEHLGDRSAFLRRVQEVVRPSRFLIRVPLFERDWRVPLKKELGVEWRLDPTHETEYTLESFDEEMTASRLRIKHREVRWGEIWAEVIPDVA